MKYATNDSNGLELYRHMLPKVIRFRHIEFVSLSFCFGSFVLTLPTF